MTRPPKQSASRRQSSAPAAQPPTVSPRWLLAAFALTLCAAALCGYAALCLLFYQGQWQFLFHPSHTITTTPATAGLAFDDIRFDVTDAGLSRLDGWWIPATSGAPYAAGTILYLHDARGSLSGSIPALAALHNLGINVFAIDYQGFGRSAGSHPTARLATENSIAAFAWLTDTRHISPRSIVVCGDGVGATFAAHLAAFFAPAGVILQDPNPPARQIFLQDARARILPLFLLQKEKLDPAADLVRAHIPRLFLDRHGDSARTRQLFHASSDPKEYFDLRAASPSFIDSALRRFLDEVLR
ncbi:MAG TPA: alpha/beta hydrolase fold domain-containing protein [Acidobacteriaceae bacterium]